MKKTRPTLLILALGVVLAGCGTTPTKTSQTEESPVTPPYKGGGYYKDDGPGANPPENLAAIPDATPKREPLHRYANDTYKVLGKKYTPIDADKPYKAKGLASWYGRKFHGKPTSTGEPYDMYAMSAAHATLPLPSYAKVTNLENGKSVVVRVNDRGPFHAGRIIDLSYTAAYKLDVLKGVTPVEVEVVLPENAPTSFSAQAEEEAVPDIKPVVLATESVNPEPLSPEPAITEPAFTRNEKAVYLQLGAFSNPATADGVMARASAKLSKLFPGVMRLEVNGLYKVQAGPFADGAEADWAAEQVLADLGIKAYKVVTERMAEAPVAKLSPATTLESAAIPPTQPAAIAQLATPIALIPPAPGLYLQLGAMSSPDAAEALANKVKSRFGNELPGLTQVTAGNLVKVQAGPFATPAAAEQLALAYHQDFGVRPYKVVR